MNSNYWENFYKEFKEETPSDFVKTLWLRDKFIVELGCGNGRDSYYLGKNNHVMAIDSAVKNKDTHSVRFFKMSAGDFINKNYQPDVVYCRFFLHSIDEKEEDRILDYSKGKELYIEVRADGDTPKVYKDHSRRYAQPDKLLKKLIDRGFRDIKLNYGRGMAKYKGEDPLVIRIYAK